MDPSMRLIQTMSRGLTTSRTPPTLPPAYLPTLSMSLSFATPDSNSSLVQIATRLIDNANQSDHSGAPAVGTLPSSSSQQYHAIPRPGIDHALKSGHPQSVQ